MGVAEVSNVLWREREQLELLLFKLEDEVLDIPAGTVVRIAPRVCRSVWNEGPDDAVLIMCSVKSDDPQGDHETVADFWPE